MENYRRYVALGDSISIDAYPGDDYRERHGLGHPVAGLGAVSLLFRNQDTVWPEFKGRDLVSLCPGLELQDATFDGATTAGVLLQQVPLVPASGDPLLVTLTAGGNDLLATVGAAQAQGDRAVAETLSHVAEILEALRARCPAAIILLGTVYDPTDGTGRLEHVQVTPRELAWLDRFNDGVRAMCRGPVRPADIHRHFRGHGLDAPPAERWYWSRSSIEPGARGASEVRRLWLEAI